MSIRKAFRSLQGREFDARGLEDAIAQLRRSAELSAEYSVEELIQFAETVGWLKPVDLLHVCVDVP